jgi:hypothetical protein
MMKKHRSRFEYGLLSVLILVACAAGVIPGMPYPIQAQTVAVTGEADVSALVDRLDQQQDQIDALRGDVNALLDVATDPGTAPAPPAPAPGTTPPAASGGTELWINVSHFGDAPVVTARGDGAYDIEPRFVELMSRWSGIRYLDWTGQLRKEVNRTWDTRVTDAHEANWRKTGLPLEAIIAVANATQTNVWWTAPQQADLDYMRRAGDLFARTLDPDLNVVLEIGNEAWQSNRGWYYDELAGGDFAQSMKLYAQDSAEKFKAFTSGGFPGGRLTRVVGGQLHNIGVLKSHVLKYLSPEEFDAITVSGYFGNKSNQGEHWRTGRQGLDESLGYLRDHAALAESIKKPLLIYELNSHVESNRDLFNSPQVIDGVQAMIDKARRLGVKTICIYAGPGKQNEQYHWPSYTPDIRPNPIVDRLGWPSLKRP